MSKRKHNMPKTPNLRDWQPNVGDAKKVENTKMLDVVAHETPDTVTAESKHVEYISKPAPAGKLGAQGRE